VFMFVNVYVTMYVRYGYVNNVLCVWALVKSREYDTL